MSVSFRFLPKERLIVEHLMHWLGRRRNGNVREYPLEDNGWRFAAKGFSLRGVELWEEKGADDEPCYSLRLNACSAPGDYDLAGDISLYFHEMHQCRPLDEDNALVPFRSVLYTNKEIKERLRSELFTLRALVQEHGLLELPGATGTFQVTTALFRLSERYQAEHPGLGADAAFLQLLLDMAWGAVVNMPRRITRPDDWYGLLLAQSKTDHIYDLIHEGLPADWVPNHRLDLCVINLAELPATLDEPAPWHWSVAVKPSKYKFPGGSYMLLCSKYLTCYLETARSLCILTDMKGREFIEISFKNRSAYKPVIARHTETILQDDDPLLKCYQIIHKAGNRGAALALAEEGLKQLNAQISALETDATGNAPEIARLRAGYNIAAIAFAWNNRYNSAAETDKQYIHQPDLWDALEEHIQLYIEMLTAKEQADYLDWLFSNRAFRKRFMSHYEAYISLLIDPHYELTTGSAIVPILNRVNNRFSAYK